MRRICKGKCEQNGRSGRMSSSNNFSMLELVPLLLQSKGLLNQNKFPFLNGVSTIQNQSPIMFVIALAEPLLDPNNHCYSNLMRTPLGQLKIYSVSMNVNRRPKFIWFRWIIFPSVPFRSAIPYKLEFDLPTVNTNVRVHRRAPCRWHARICGTDTLKLFLSKSKCGGREWIPAADADDGRRTCSGHYAQCTSYGIATGVQRRRRSRACVVFPVRLQCRWQH